MAAPEGNVVAFTGGSGESAIWNALSIGNAARAMDGVLASIRPAARALDDAAAAEMRLAADAAALSEILAKLAHDVEALRRRYL